jgi:hypothetical protein
VRANEVLLYIRGGMKKMKISNDFKDKLESTIRNKNTKYTYIPGQLIQCKGTNMSWDCDSMVIMDLEVIIQENDK